MRDRTHAEHIERWAEFVKTHPRSVWIKEVKPLIDSQIIMANKFYERLAKTEGGLEKIRRLREKSGFNLEDTFFKMHTLRASKALSENHDEIYKD
ncbi:MAG TPA: hypothetical protein VF360_04220 [Candidatus Methanoperedens sp.]|jgi:hypothetical protein